MKRIKSMIVILLVFLMFTSTVFAYEDVSSVDLKNDLRDNNSTLDILDLNVKNMEIDVYKAELSSRKMDSTIERLRSYGFRPSGTALSGMMYVRDVVPDQVKYGLYVLENNIDITEETLSIAMRQMIMGVISSEDAYNLDVQKRDFYKSEYDNAQLQYDLGLVSSTVLLQAEVKYLEKETYVLSSARSLEDSFRTLNNFIGYDLDKRYEIIREDQMIAPISDPSVYLEYAMENRFEFKNLNEQIIIQEKIADFYDYGDFLGYYENYRAMKDAEIEKERLLLELLVTEQTIAEEIYSAVSDIQILDAQIKQLENTLAMQKNDYEKLMAQVNQGYMTESIIKELEFAITSIENSLNLMNYSYNTKRYEFFNSTQIGPAYGGGL